MQPRTLIIEDDSSWQENLHTILIKMGCKVDIAGDHNEVRHLLNDHKYDLAVVDVAFKEPDVNKNCLEFFVFLHRNYPKMPVAAITGKPLSEIEEWILPYLNVVKFFHKGSTFNKQRFEDSIHEIVFASPVFISYRREDSAWVTGRLYDYLSRHFGEYKIFVDTIKMPVAQNWEMTLKEKVGKCKVLIAVIGTQWLRIADEHGRRRLDNRRDYVRWEIKTALNNGNTKVIPVLVDDTKMPWAHTLPKDLRALALLPPQPIHCEQFREDAETLVKKLEKLLDGS